MRVGFGQFAVNALNLRPSNASMRLLDELRLRFIDAPVRPIELLLPHLQNAEIGPTGGFSRRDLGGTRDILLRETSSPDCRPASPK